MPERHHRSQPTFATKSALADMLGRAAMSAAKRTWAGRIHEYALVTKQSETAFAHKLLIEVQLKGYNALDKHSVCICVTLGAVQPKLMESIVTLYGA
jgi:hypothetical protein